MMVNRRHFPVIYLDYGKFYEEYGKNSRANYPILERVAPCYYSKQKEISFDKDCIIRLQIQILS